MRFIKKIWHGVVSSFCSSRWAFIFSLRSDESVKKPTRRGKQKIKAAKKTLKNYKLTASASRLKHVIFWPLILDKILNAFFFKADRTPKISCSYILGFDFSEIEKYSGVLSPRNMEVFQSRLAQKGMLDQGNDFLMASGKLSAILYREEMERLLRTPEMDGYQATELIRIW